MKEKILHEINQRKVAIHCPTQEEADKLYELLGDKIYSAGWTKHEADTCFFYYSGSYANITWAKENNCKILSAEYVLSALQPTPQKEQPIIANLQPGTKVRVRSDLKNDGTYYYMSNSTKSDVANGDMVIKAGTIVTIKALYNSKYRLHEVEGFWTDEMFSEIISLPDEEQAKLEPSTKRNLAFYKRSGKPWTKEEVHNINKYCGDCNGPAMSSLRYIFDDGMDNEFMHDWYQQKNHPNFSNCKQVAYEDVFPTTQEVNNPFKVGDRIRSILADNPVDRPYGKEFTVVKVYEEEVYYKDGFAAHYSKFELVSKANIQSTESSIKVGSHWQEMYTSTSKGPIVKVTKLYKESVSLEDIKTNQKRSISLSDFSRKFVPITLNSSQSKSTKVESTNQTIKEQPMTIQQLLQTLFGAEKPTTDYDKRPAILVVAYNRDGSQMGQAIADNIDQVKDKVADTPELWGCKVLTYTLDQEVSVDVPVKATKAKAAKPTKE